MFSPTSLGQAIKYSFTFLYRLKAQKGPNPLATNLTLTRLPWVLVPSPQQLVKGPTLGVGLTGTPQHPLFERGKNLPRRRRVCGVSQGEFCFGANRPVYCIILSYDVVWLFKTRDLKSW